MTFILSPTDEILSALGKRVRQQRLAQELPQQELAAMAAVSLGAVRKLETTGRSSLDTLVRVIQALGLIGELDGLLVLKRTSITDMEQAETAKGRQRAPRRQRHGGPRQ